MDKALMDAYEQALYRVKNPELHIRIGQRNPELVELLEKEGAATWAIITAENPQSFLLDKTENRERMEKLSKEVARFTHFAGQALDPQGEWPPEENLLILDIDREEATFLGKKWEQNAIVFGGNDGRGKLLWL
jgi:hypothetical protein